MVFRSFYTVLCLFSVLCGLMAFPAPGQAQESLFTIRNVKVDVTADSAVKAREQAFAKAQQDAFTQLAERVLSAEAMANFKPPEAATISPMVNDFEITDERLSHVQYIGTYTFRFNPDAVRGYFGLQGVSYTDVTSKPVLILPFYQQGAQPLLWGGDNPWLAAWTRNETWQGVVPATVPIGDLQDTTDIADHEMLSYRPEGLQSLTDRYGAKETIIMLATPVFAGNPEPGKTPSSLHIAFYSTADGSPALAHEMDVQAAPNETPEALFDRAVKEARDVLQSDWKTKTAVTGDQVSDIEVRVRFGTMQEWVETQKALKRVQGINGVNLVSIKPGEAHVKLAYQGTEERLRLALAQADMTLSSPQVAFGQGGAPLVYDLFLSRYAPAPAPGYYPQ